MTIHSEHPFADPEDARRPGRRLRGRMPAPVTVLTTGSGDRRVGLTVSSVLVADGEPPRVLALVDEESELYAALAPDAPVALAVLAAGHRAVADVLAGQAPSPGGAFRTGEWTDTEWGPVPVDAQTWAGCRVREAGREVGWSRLVELVVEHVGAGADEQAAGGALAYLRGRYREL